MTVVVLAIALALGALTACGGGKSNPVQPTPPAPAAPAPNPTPATTRIIAVSENLSFGNIALGSTKELSFSISNSGNAPLNVTGISAPSGYTVGWTTGTIAAGGKQTVVMRFAPTSEQAYDGTVTVNGDQTSGTNTITASGRGTRPLRRATVTDPSHDALVFAFYRERGIDPPPDLVGATIDVFDGILAATISFARGTLSQPDTYGIVYVDADENPATGHPGINQGNDDASLIGVDYAITFGGRTSSPRGTVSQEGRVLGRADVTFPTPDQARVEFPLALFGNDDGRLAFKVGVSQYFTHNGANAVSVQFDFMPDVGRQPGRTR